MNRAESYRGLIEKLRQRKIRLVLAESCTGGLAAARLTEISGASEVLCGSMVTYRQTAKTAWLGVAEEVLQEFSAVSAEVTREMGRAILRSTPEATLAAAITGHLGPDAPPALDGILYATILWRNEAASATETGLIEMQHRLQASTRVERQREAADFLLGLLERSMDRPDAPRFN